jgi:hypothetical protein
MDLFSPLYLLIFNKYFLKTFIDYLFSKNIILKYSHQPIQGPAPERGIRFLYRGFPYIGWSFSLDGSIYALESGPCIGGKPYIGRPYIGW